MTSDHKRARELLAFGASQLGGGGVSSNHDPLDATQIRSCVGVRGSRELEHVCDAESEVLNITKDGLVYKNTIPQN
jgi:hypothetical protein